MKNKTLYIGTLLGIATLTGAVALLLLNIFERKVESNNRFVLLQDVGEDDTDPAKWAINWPKQYDSYKQTALATRTRFGGHGGSEAMPDEKIDVTRG